MRIVGSLVDHFFWRVKLAGTGIRLRLRGLLSVLTIVGGLGAAIGFAIVDRLERARVDAEDETSRSPE